MTKKIVVAFFLFSFSIFTHNALAKSSVWKISQGDNYFYLGGTIHVLSKEDYPLPIEFDKAYKDADKIIFETDLVASQSPEFNAKFAALISYSDGRNLASELTPDVYRKLENFMSVRQVPITHFSRLKPWGASLILSLLEYQRLGMVADYGVESFFSELANSDKKPIGALETPQQQLNALKSLELVEPNNVINYTLRDLERLPEFIKIMNANWRKGDMHAFTKNPLINQMKDQFPAVYKVLVVDRNNQWMKQIPSFINDSEIEFVLVGSLHINDHDGLLNQLKRQGFKVEQL